MHPEPQELLEHNRQVACKVTPIERLPYTPTAFEFADERLGWITTDAGLILHTRDAGVTWQTQNPRSDHVLYDVHLVDARHGWAVGALNKEGLERNVPLGGILGKSSEDGVAVAMFTDDGGLRWSEVHPGPEEDLNAVWFLTPGLGWVVGDCGAIRHTRDRGRTWIALDSDASIDWVDCFFADAQNGWFVGHETAEEDDSPVDADKWLEPRCTIRDYGVLYRTVDGAQSLVACERVADVNLHSIAFPDARHGWVVGDKGTVLATCDGGDTWARQITGVRDTLRDVCFADAQMGWAVGDNGVVLYTEDGGDTWRREYVADAGRFTSVATCGCVPWAAGQGGVFLLETPPEAPSGIVAPRVTIRQIRPSDVPSVQGLYLDPMVLDATVRLPYPFCQPWGHSLHVPSSGTFFVDTSENIGLVALAEGEVVGYLGMSLDTSYRRRGLLRLALAVSAPTRGTGVGGALLRHALEVVDGWLPVMRIECLVYPDNASALMLLKRYGFDSEGTLRSFACRGRGVTDVTIMSRIG